MSKLYHCDKCDCDVINKSMHLKAKKHNSEKYKKKPKKLTDEERRASRVETQRKYNAKKWHCEVCDKQIGISHKAHHVETKVHTNALNLKQVIPTKPVVDDTNNMTAYKQVEH